MWSGKVEIPNIDTLDYVYPYFYDRLGDEVTGLSLVFMFTGVRHSTYRDARGVAHSYFFSWEHGPTRSLEVDWLDARNICRRHCMDAVSLETPQENEFVKQRIARGNNCREHVKQANRGPNVAFGSALTFLKQTDNTGQGLICK